MPASDLTTEEHLAFNQMQEQASVFALQKAVLALAEHLGVTQVNSVPFPDWYHQQAHQSLQLMLDRISIHNPQLGARFRRHWQSLENFRLENPNN